MPASQDTRSDSLARRATAAGVGLALAALALMLPTPPTADHVLLAAPDQAAATWAAGATPAAPGTDRLAVR